LGSTRGSLMLDSLSELDESLIRLMDSIVFLEKSTPLIELLRRFDLEERDFGKLLYLMEKIGQRVLLTEEKDGVIVHCSSRDAVDRYRQLRYPQTKVSLSEIATKIQQAVHNQKSKLVQISLANHAPLLVYVHNLIFLDEALSLICERCDDKSLQAFDTDKIVEICEVTTSSTGRYFPTYSPMEISKFITEIRALNGKEERLVIKILSSAEINLNPPFHYWVNPYVAINDRDERIWAASVELSGQLFEWLNSLRGYIEILAPQTVREELELYRKNKNTKIINYLKKVS